MKVHSIRLGFATNSSSSHSIIFLPGVKDREHQDEIENCEFGWSTFTCASRPAKMRYFGTALFNALERVVGPQIAHEVVRGVAGVSIPKDSYIDHQSSICLPLSRDGKGIDLDFARELRDYLASDGVVILGGNDNDGEHELDGHGPNVNPGLDSINGNMIALKDPRGFWTMFQPRTGAKLRMSFDPPGIKNDVTKATRPELIDLSITDKCASGCKWCYRDSHPDGQHAMDTSLRDIRYLLEKLQPFEVAIGGGEPTEHPGFIDLLAGLRSAGIVPSFSTRSLDWLHHNERRESILNHAARFGFSVSNQETVGLLASVMDRYGVPHNRCTIHAIVGVCSHTSILEACAERHFGVLLLGFKRVGRACTLKPHDYDKIDNNWVRDIVKMRDKFGWHMPSISADTLLCSQSESELKAAGVSPALYATQEGKFSMFIDAVGGRMGPSSFCTESEMVQLPQRPREPGMWDWGAQGVLDSFVKW